MSDLDFNQIVELWIACIDFKFCATYNMIIKTK